MHQYHVIVDGKTIAVYDNKYQANNHAITFAGNNAGSNVEVEYRYLSK